MELFYIFMFLLVMCFLTVGTPISLLFFYMIIFLGVYALNLGMWVGVLLTIGGMTLVLVLFSFGLSLKEGWEIERENANDPFGLSLTRAHEKWKNEDIKKIARDSFSPKP